MRTRGNKMSTPEAEIPVALASAAQAVPIEGAIETLKTVLKLPSERDYFIFLAITAQAHMIDLLESVVYIGLKGARGTGKGTAVECFILLTPNGVILAETTAAYLASVLDEGRTIAIQEADSVLQNSPILTSILRDGYRRGATKGLMVKDENGEWTPHEKSIFGGKAFDFHSLGDTHLLGRTHVIPMERDDSVDRAMDAEKKARHLAPVRKWLIAEASRAKERWTKERVDEIWDDEAFRDEVVGLGGKSGREHVIGANLLLVCKVMEWEGFDAIRAAMKDRRAVDDLSDAAEVIGVILELSESLQIGADDPVLFEAILETINDRRAGLRLPHMSVQKFGAVLDDLGFKKPQTWQKLTGGQHRNKSAT